MVFSKENIASEVFGIPESLVLASIDGEDERIVGLSPNSIRLCEEVSKLNKLELVYYSFTEDKYISLNIEEYELSDGLIFVKYKPFSDAVNFVVKQYQKYILAKSNSVGNSFSNEMVGYPDDTDYEIYGGIKENLYARFDDCLNVVKEYCRNKGLELAISLDTNKKWLNFINNPSAYMDFDRIYIGNQFCPYMRPDFDSLINYIKLSKSSNINITFVLSYLPDMLVDMMNEYLKKLYSFLCEYNYRIEVSVNDYAYFEIIAPFVDRMDISFGLLLNKRRKDPRYQYKKGVNDRLDLLSKNQLDSKGLQDFLKEKGVKRFEFDLCGYESQITCESSSLHMPLYQSNTGAYCTLKAACAFGDRGKQRQQDTCAGYCNDYFFAYSKESKMIGLGNSLFGIQNIDYEVLQKSIGKADRIVWNIAY